MNKFKKIISYPFRIILICLIKIYKLFIDPILPKTCGFVPTCSKYMELSIKEFGVFKGLFLGTKRLLKCRPGGKCGFDPIPLNIKGDLKWLL